MGMLRTVHIFVGCLVFCFLMSIVTFDMWKPHLLQVHIRRPLSHTRQERAPVILFWTDFFSDKEWGIGVGRTKFHRRCDVKCELTNDKSRFNESKAILIHVRNPVTSLPSYRQPWQHVVFFIMESPYHTPNLRGYANFFNYTITYHRHSDIYAPEGRFVKRNKTSLNDMTLDNLKNKSKDIVWVVGNCHPPSQREVLVSELKKTINVDVFGMCGKRCDDACFNGIKHVYKFYLAFENSLCDDYVTEKLYRSFIWGLIPIVFGGSTYKELIPKKSFIDVADFKSVKDLALYVRKVSSNKTLYNSYFDWKKEYYFDEGYDKYNASLCTLCKNIHQGKLPNKTYTDIQSWWHKDKCKSPKIQYPNYSKIFQ